MDEVTPAHNIDRDPRSFRIGLLGIALALATAAGVGWYTYSIDSFIVCKNNDISIETRLEACDRLIDDPGLDGPTRINALLNRAGLLSRLEDFSGAIEDHSTLIQLRPEKSWSYFERARLLFKLGRLDRALLDTEKASGLSPGNGDIRALSANIRYTLKDYVRAAEDIDLAVSLGYWTTKNSFIQTWILYRRGNFQLALERFNEHYSQGIPLDWRTYTIRGALFHKMGNFSQATMDFAKAQQLSKHEYDVHFLLKALGITLD
jgi:tetratricopeptide (TPR) repeat protein